MLKYLRPGAIYRAIWEIDVEQLAQKGIKHLLVDLDNTLVEYQKYEVHPQLEEWLARVNQAGFKVCIVSNSRRSQNVRALAERLKIPAVTRAGKPRLGGFLKALGILGCRPETTAVIGDQLLTDILGGNRLGCYTVLVRPLSKHEFLGTRLVRIVERAILRCLSGGTERYGSED